MLASSSGRQPSTPNDSQIGRLSSRTIRGIVVAFVAVLSNVHDPWGVNWYDMRVTRTRYSDIVTAMEQFGKDAKALAVA
jgi:hypothetical protein